MTKFKSWLNVKNIVIFSLGAIVLYFWVISLVNLRLNNLETSLRRLISDQEKSLVNMVELIARNGADVRIESLVKDCAIDERNKFDNLLSRLDSSLTNQELTELERLFGRCGDFFSNKRLAMSMLLSREVEIYDAYVRQLEIVNNESLLEFYKLSQWHDLVGVEQSIAESFRGLVITQEKIINRLLLGSKSDSSEILEILEEVKLYQAALTAQNIEAVNLRTQILEL